MPGEVNIAVIAPSEPEDFFDLLWQGVWEATFDLASFGVEVRNLTTPGYDLAGQRQILESLLEESVQGIALLPAHSSGLEDLIARHQSAGTPVVTFHADAPASGRSAFVGTNPFDAGALAGEVLAKLMGSKGQVLSFPGTAGKYYLERRHRGARAEFALRAGMRETVWNTAVEDDDPDLQAAIWQADGFYIGDEDLPKVAGIIQQTARKAPCVGFSNTDRARCLLELGSIDAVIDESRYRQGYFAVQKAYEAAVRRPGDAELAGIAIPANVVFSSNAPEACDSLNNAFETLVRQRTAVLCSYKSRLQQANAELLSLATTDPLTGLMNRRKFEETIRQEVARAIRYGPLSLLMIDVDRFKLINDNHGHAAGDEALKAVARILTTTLRMTDTCARLGGDEFAVILPHTDGQGAEVVRRRILAAAARSTGYPGGPLSLSIGIASLTDAIGAAESLMAAADQAMYRAKPSLRMTQVETFCQNETGQSLETNLESID